MDESAGYKVTYGKSQPEMPQHTPRQEHVPECTPEPPSPEIASPYLFFFSFTLRKADGVGLGLDLQRSIDNRVLVVREVAPKGAIDAWNRQAVKGPHEEKALNPGDKIVCVNDRTDCDSMLAECTEKFLVKISVVRGGPACVVPCWPYGSKEQQHNQCLIREDPPILWEHLPAEVYDI